MTHIREVYAKDVKAAVKVLHPKDGDIVVVRLSDEAGTQQAQDVSRSLSVLREALKVQVVPVVIGHTMDFDLLPFDDFRALAQKVAEQRGFTVTFEPKPEVNPNQLPLPIEE